MADRRNEAVAIGGARRRLAGGEAGAVVDRRTDEVGEPLEDVDAHRPPAADAKAGGAVEALRQSPDRPGSRCGPSCARCAMSSTPFWSSPPCFSAQSCAARSARRRLQQRRQIEMIGAEADAVLAQRGARRPGRGCGRRQRPRERSRTPSASAIWKAMPRAMPVSSGDSSSFSSGPSRRTTWALSHALEARLDLVARRAGELLVGEDAQARLEELVARLELAPPGRRASASTPSFDSTSDGVGRRREPLGPGLDLARQRLAGRRCAAPWLPRPPACGSGTKWKPCRWPTCCPSTVTSPVAVISASSMAFSLRRRMSTLVRRSTKRWASRSCSASDSLSST